MRPRTVLRSSRRDDGAAAVEFALVSSLLILLVFGIVDFGWMINRDTIINNASREGAREGAVAKAGAAAEVAATSSLTSAGIPVGNGPYQASITVTCVHATPPTTCDPYATTGATAPVSGDRIKVTVTLDHKWITPVGSTFGASIPLQKVTEMRME